MRGANPSEVIPADTNKVSNWTTTLSDAIGYHFGMSILFSGDAHGKLVRSRRIRPVLDD